MNYLQQTPPEGYYQLPPPGYYNPPLRKRKRSISGIIGRSSGRGDGRSSLFF